LHYFVRVNQLRGYGKLLEAVLFCEKLDLAIHSVVNFVNVIVQSIGEEIGIWTSAGLREMKAHLLIDYQISISI